VRLSRKGYDHRPLAALLEQLLEEHNETARGTSLASGLDHGAVGRFLRGEVRPHRDTCIVLAEHFGLNPNELLEAAGYEPLTIFDLSLADPSEFPPEVKQVALALGQIADPTLRRDVCSAIHTLALAILEEDNTMNDGTATPEAGQKVHSSGSL
jgi:hypothetical protein